MYRKPKLKLKFKVGDFLRHLESGQLFYVNWTHEYNGHYNIQKYKTKGRKTLLYSHVESKFRLDLTAKTLYGG